MAQGSIRLKNISRCKLSACIAGAAIGLTLILCGCRHPELGDLPEPVRTAIFAPRPPLFLIAPIGSLFTNIPGFTARVVLKRGSDELETAAGQLLAAGGKLLFAPEKDEPLGRNAPAPGFSFIWDANQNRGWLLSEALQGYAPTSSNRAVTNVMVQVSAAAPQTIAGHTCRPETDTFQLNDGSTVKVEVLRAIDLNGFPMQITSSGESTPLTVTFSHVKLQVPDGRLFNPPEGFTRYTSGETMVDELAARQRILKTRRY